ncbi:hypothetical protein N7G274_002901 [Stereocaulon virgatum]|uniref:Uncharacterized protein n=1 Tax=Stereocaulon virgatum TaxID=373712 RepID=A0ABR4AH71_9LECA
MDDMYNVLKLAIASEVHTDEPSKAATRRWDFILHLTLALERRAAPHILPTIIQQDISPIDPRDTKALRQINLVFCHLRGRVPWRDFDLIVRENTPLLKTRFKTRQTLQTSL